MSDFVGFARACGLDLLTIKTYDKIQRCPTFAKPQHKNGAYLIRSDGNGWCIAYDGGGELNWFDDPSGPKAWSEAEKAAWQARKREQERADAARHAQAAKAAQDALKTCHLGTSGYLVRKGFPDMQALCLPDGATFVPMRNLTTNAVQGAQVIRWLTVERQWEKKFTPGTRAKGAVFRLGPASPVPTILVEGVATAYSVEAACRQMHLNAAVLICFSAGNIVHVAEQLANAPFDRCVFADNDKSGTGAAAAQKTGLPWAMSPHEGFDANDQHQTHGLMSLCWLVMKAIRGTR